MYSENKGHIKLFLILLSAISIRLLFFAGPLGSDDTVYFERSLEIANGIWTSADYNGALRYGFNIPAGFFLYCFGPSYFNVNLWPFLCSIIEIIIVYYFSSYFLGRKAAVYSAIILAFLPIHICAATKIHADSVISLFISLSFILFFIGIKQNRSIFYFLSGLSTGFVFWCRELAIFYMIAFFIYPLLFKCLKKNMLYFIFGGIVMLLSHLCLIFFVSGDPFHFFNTIFNQINADFIHGTKIHDPFFYFTYLFLKPFHTGILGYLFFGGCVLIFTKMNPVSEGHRYLAYWAISLLLLFSFFPISFSPFKFVTKQVNYMTMFMTPLAILSGCFLSQLPRKAVSICLTIIFFTGISLGAMEQQTRRVFISNSQAVVSFAKENPTAVIYGSSNNVHIAKNVSLIERSNLSDRILPLKSMKKAREIPENSYAVIDLETIGWSARDKKYNQIPPCWSYVKTLAPEGFGLGHELLGLMIKLFNTMPYTPAKVEAMLIKYYRPKTAKVYRITCFNEKSSSQ